MEFLDQRRRRRPAEVERAQDRLAEREVLDPLRRPLGTDLRAGNAPHLLRVRGEERVVEPGAEVPRDPLLEGLRLRAGGADAAAEVREGTERRLDDPEAGDDVAGLERVGEVLPVVVDAREARPDEELVAHHLVPEPLDLPELREEAMAPEVEAVALVLDGLRDPADEPVGLVDDAGGATQTEHVRRRQARGACSEHGRAHGFPVPRHRRPSLPADRSRDSRLLSPRRPQYLARLRRVGTHRRT